MLAIGSERKPFYSKLGKDVVGFNSVAEVMAEAKLNWTVEKKPIFLGGCKKIPNRFATVRTDTGATLGIVGNNYEVVQNEQAFDFINDCMGEGLTFVKAGTYNRGERVFVAAKAPSVDICGDEIIPHLLFTNSYDGSGSIGATFTPMRLICSNGLMIPAKGYEKDIIKLRISHTKSAPERLVISKGLMIDHDKYIKNLKCEAEELLATPFSDNEYLQLSNELAGISNVADEKVTKGQLTMVEDLAQAFQEDDIRKFDGTAWGAVTAVSDFNSHKLNSRNTGNDEYQFERVAYGMTALVASIAIINRMVAMRP